VAPSIGGALAAAALLGLEGMDVDRISDRKRALFSDRAVVPTDLAPGMPRSGRLGDESVGRGEGMLRTRAEYNSLLGAVAPGAGARKGS